MTSDEPDWESLIYDVAAAESLSEGVVEAVPPADPDAEGALDPLFSVVDPDALDAVFRGSDDGAVVPRGEVTSCYHGYEVTVRSEGRISLTRREPTSGWGSD
jgi:hypothetical protein